MQPGSSDSERHSSTTGHLGTVGSPHLPSYSTAGRNQNIWSLCDAHTSEWTAIRVVEKPEEIGPSSTRSKTCSSRLDMTLADFKMKRWDELSAICLLDRAYSMFTNTDNHVHFYTPHRYGKHPIWARTRSPKSILFIPANPYSTSSSAHFLDMALKHRNNLCNAPKKARQELTLKCRALLLGGGQNRWESALATAGREGTQPENVSHLP